MATLAELQAAKIAGGGIGPVRGYTEVGGYAYPNEFLPENRTWEPLPELNLMAQVGPKPSIQAPAGIIPTALAAIGGVVPALAGVAGIAAAGYGLFQALGGGEGEGLFGLDILGGGNGDTYRDGIPFGGPGLKEPPAEYVEKEWHVSYDWGRLQYYMVKMPTGGRKIALYNTRTKKWKVWSWRTPRLAVIGKNMPSHKMITRLRRNLKKHSADARTILKMTSPASLATGGRGYQGGRHGHKRR